MSQCSILKLDYPPSTNRLWRYVNGRAIKSAEYRTWLEAQAWSLQRQNEKPVLGPYAMHIEVSRPDRRRRDITNTIKALEDAVVAAGFVEDDSYCQKLTVEWVRGGHPVKIFITATEER